MKNITIGIPRGLLYYKYKHLWAAFFKELGVNILISPYTDKSIIESITNEVPKEYCLPLKIYFGHVKYLLDKTDYILVHRIDKKDCCYYFNSLHDIIHNKYNIKILDFNIDKKNNEEEAFIRMGHALGFGRQISQNAYKIAKKQDYKYKKINYLLQKNKLKKKSNKLLIVSNDYIYNDEYIKTNIINLKNMKNIDFIYSDIINPDKNAKVELDDFKNLNKKIYIIPNYCFKKNINLNNKFIINLCEKNIDSIINDYVYDKENNCE